MTLSHHAAWDANDWTAFGTVGLLVLAIVAACYAAQQLAEAKRSRKTATDNAYNLKRRQIRLLTSYIWSRSSPTSYFSWNPVAPMSICLTWY